MIKMWKNLWKKIKIVFTSNIVYDLNRQEVIKKYLEGRPFRDSKGYILVAQEGQLHFSPDNGETWKKADNWTVIDQGGKMHIAYSTRNSSYPNRHDVMYTSSQEDGAIDSPAKVVSDSAYTSFPSGDSGSD